MHQNECHNVLQWEMNRHKVKTVPADVAYPRKKHLAPPKFQQRDQIDCEQNRKGSGHTVQVEQYGASSQAIGPQWYMTIPYASEKERRQQREQQN